MNLRFCQSPDLDNVQHISMPPHSQSTNIKAGQRWISETEPELGLGILLKVEFKRLEITFPAASETRIYALDSAPIRRVSLKTGESLQTATGKEYLVDGVKEQDGLLIYICSDQEIPEAQLADTMSFSKPEDRLLAGHTDPITVFDLRAEALTRQAAVMQSPSRGFIGGRVDLIPHQMYIANEVASRLKPRVLLADEVGLGKTIEACLIMHRLHLTGRADRVLILLPEPLLHQWFVELLRRFNMLFSLFDEERCEAIETGGEGADNPFLDSQLTLCSVDFLANSKKRANQVIAAGWDLLIVDEAHHLEWQPNAASKHYKLVEDLAKKTESLLLLTATPRQLGAEGHFARMRLLDPDKYVDIEHIQEEAQHYEELAKSIELLIAKKPLSKKHKELFSSKSNQIKSYFDTLDQGNETARQPLIQSLLETFGTGRVMFRNTREALSGFPERKAHLTKINSKEEKIQWLVQLLHELGEKKVLLICKSQELSEQLAEQLKSIININCAHFHEGMTLLQRDRSAAYFSEDDGARILICSEIGSEGRNFQFAHHLVLYDLPENPELLEQRIGRLDRIGQSETIKIHVPYIEAEREEQLARWYHDGLDAFEHSLHGATEILKELGGLPKESMSEDEFLQFIKKSQQSRAQIAQQLKKGYDRLLELNSNRPEVSQDRIHDIESHDNDKQSEQFLVRLWDHFGLHVEELSHRSYLLLPGHLITNEFPALPDDGLNITFDRTKALSREDTTFMSWDHPMARVALDLLLTSEAGNSSFAVWEGAPQKSIMLEAHYIIECLAPQSLQSERFLPPTPIQVQVDHTGNNISGQHPSLKGSLRSGDLHRLLNQEAFRKNILPSMLENTSNIAEEGSKKLITSALEKATYTLDLEIKRLIALGEANDHISQDEISALERQKSELIKAISKSRIRLDSIRVIWCQV